MNDFDYYPKIKKLESLDKKKKLLDISFLIRKTWDLNLKLE